jgi:glycosyltransferase involved in cell wall biosynthesis
MKIVICWSNYTGYWATCWRKLAQRPEVDLFVIASRPSATSPFGEDLLEGIPHRLLDEEEQSDKDLVTSLVAELEPDVVQIVGWFVPAYRALATSPQLKDAKKFISVDTQFRHWAQILTRWRYRHFFNNITGVGVTGERSLQYVKRLGFPMSRIRRHMYGVDEHLTGEIYNSRSGTAKPKSFLFVGRYSPEKGLDVLVEAYRLYRDASDSPWDLVCCGSGPEGYRLEGQAGIHDKGFVHPDDLHSHFLDAGAYVISSRSDNWPLATVEAAMSGLPIIASDACGTVTEIVRPNYNGYITATGDAAALAEAMLKMERAPAELWGQRAREHALPFTSELWAERWLEFFRLSQP